MNVVSSNKKRLRAFSDSHQCPENLNYQLYIKIFIGSVFMDQLLWDMLIYMSREQGGIN